MYTGRRLPYPSRLRSRIWLPEDFAFSPHLMGNSSRLRDEPETIFHQALGFRAAARTGLSKGIPVPLHQLRLPGLQHGGISGLLY